MTELFAGMMVYCVLMMAWGTGYWMGQRDERRRHEKFENLPTN